MVDMLRSVTAGPSTEPSTGHMHTILDTLDGRKLLTVLDTDTQVCVAPIAVVEALGYSYVKESDITLSSADDMTTDPVGVCHEFKFKLGPFIYTVKAYVVRKASFQLLLGNEFLWSVGYESVPHCDCFPYLEAGRNARSRNP
jgi:hypothetical protein